MRDRAIGADDLFLLMEWARTGPEVPAGNWFKDFGTFKLCGTGSLPKAFLLPGRRLRHGSRRLGEAIRRAAKSVVLSPGYAHLTDEARAGPAPARHSAGTARRDSRI